MSIIGWLILGLIAGFIASKIVKLAISVGLMPWAFNHSISVTCRRAVGTTLVAFLPLRLAMT
jgi:hypothetical protein